jgi:hypothetical protein
MLLEVETWFLESFLGGLVTGFGMFCFGKALRFGRTTFSRLWVTGLQDDWGCSYGKRMVLAPTTRYANPKPSLFTTGIYLSP